MKMMPAYGWSGFEADASMIQNPTSDSAAPVVRTAPKMDRRLRPRYRIGRIHRAARPAGSGVMDSSSRFRDQLNRA